VVDAERGAAFTGAVTDSADEADPERAGNSPAGGAAVGPPRRRAMTASRWASAVRKRQISCAATGWNVAVPGRDHTALRELNDRPVLLPSTRSAIAAASSSPSGWLQGVPLWRSVLVILSSPLSSLSTVSSMFVLLVVLRCSSPSDGSGAQQIWM